MVTSTPARQGSPSTPRRRTRPSPPRTAAAGRHLLALAIAVLAALPVHAAAATDPEKLPIPEGSSAPTTLSGGGGGTLLRLGLGLVVVIGLISLIWYVLKRIQRTRYPALDERGPSLIEVVANTPLGPNRSLHLVRLGDELVLIGSTDHNVNAIVRVGAEDVAGLIDPAPRGGFARSSSAAPRTAMDDRDRAVATATDSSLVDRLRAMTTRR